MIELYFPRLKNHNDRRERVREATTAGQRLPKVTPNSRLLRRELYSPALNFRSFVSQPDHP